MPSTLPPALDQRQFRLFWLGTIFAWTGSQIQFWALIWHVRALSDQPLAAGALGLIRVIPMMLLSLAAGFAADRFSRRRVMIAAQILTALSALTIASLTLRQQANLGWIYAVTALSSLALTFELPARESLVPNLVPIPHLSNAFSLHTFALQAGSLAGPLLNGFLIRAYGLGVTYALSAAGALVMATSLALIGQTAQEREAKTVRHFSLDAIRQGVRYTFHNPLILSSMLLDFFTTTLTRANTILPFVARDILKVGEVGYGFLSAAQSIGATTMGFALSQVKHMRRQGVVLLGAVSLVGLGTVVLGMARSFALAFTTLALVGGADAASTVVRSTIRQTQTPDRLRGRMVGVNQIFFMGGPQLGEVRAGLVGALAGVPLAIASGGAACLLALAWIARRWPQLQHYNGDEAPLVPPLVD